MNFLQRFWSKYQQKSKWAKASDAFFLLLLITIMTTDGRILLQRGLLEIGLFSDIEKNADALLDEEDWTLQFTNDEGQMLTLQNFKGKPIFLNFWATWCPPCNAEMPSIMELEEKVGDNAHFVLLTSENEETVEKHLQSKGWNMPVYYLKYMGKSKLQASALPTTFIIDHEGKLVHTSGGMRNWSDAQDLLY